MTINKKICNLILSLLLVFGMFGSTLGVEAIAAATPTLSAESKSVTVGDTFTVAVKLTNATSVYGGNFTLQYDSSLFSAESYTFGSIISGHTKNCNLNYQSAGNLIRFTFSGAEAVSSSGTLVTITFKAKAAGTASLKFNAYKMYNENGSALTSSATGSSITVSATAASAPTLSTESKSVTVGDTFTVAVKLSNVSSVYGGNFTLQYDSSLLSAESYTFGSIISGHTKNCNLNYQSAGNLIRFTFSGAEAVSSSGTLVTITFKAKASGTASLKFNAYKMYDQNGSALTSSATGSSVTVKAKAASAPTLSTESKSVTVGDTFTVAVKLSNVSSVYGGNFTLQYDSSFLSAESYSFGSIISGHTKNCNLNYQSAGNLIRFTFSGAEAVSSSGTLVTITFKAKASGTASLKFNAYKMYDQNGSALTSSATGSSITVKAKATDTTKPTGSISSTNNTAASQTVTLTLSDNVGVAGYYWGTSNTYTNNTYTSTSASSVKKTVSTDGTYYLVVKDTSGNVSTSYSITFRKITFNANGGSSISPSYIIVKSGNTVTLPSAKPTRSGYSFLGWSTSSSATSATYQSGGSVTVNANLNLYAVWKIDTAKALQIVVESKEVNKGEEFTVTVSLKNNPGIASLLITPVYSDELTLVSAENGKLMSDFTKGKNYFWDSASDVKKDGVLMTLKFKTSSTVKSGTYNVGFTVINCINADLNNVNVKVTEGKITVNDFIWGDANGDGDVTPADVVLLRRYFANYNSDTGISSITIFPGADANGDGEVTPADVVLLRRYFANYDSATDSSSIILGPTQKSA